jgi:hypothetical protein
MANKKINQLVSKTAILSTDIFGIGDATTGQLFKKTIAELQAAIGGAVISVNGLVGTVVLDTDDIQELATPTNKYFTDARARGAISLTVTGNSGASTYSSGTGVLNVPTYTLAGLGGITATFLSGGAGISYNSGTGVISYSGTVYTDASIRALFSGGTGITYNSSTGAISYSGTVYTDSSVRALISMTTTGDSGASTYNNTTGVINVPNYTLAGLGGISLTSLSGGTGITYNNTTGAISYSGTVYTDASVRALISVTSPISYNNTTGVISISQASTSVSGFLSNTDWNTFNNKQGTITLTTTGTSGNATFSSNTLNIPNYGSALSGYLPLTGGTLTGALGGTSATFSGLVTLNSNEPLILNRTNNTSTSNAIRFQTGGTTQWYVGSDSYLQSGTENFGFYNGAYRLIITPAGNLGLGVTPSAWGTSFKAIQFGQTGILSSGLGASNFGHNYYYDGTNPIYLTTSNASLYQQGTGQHNWYTAPSGTVGTTVTFTQVMTLNTSGYLGVGTTTPSYLLDVNGNGGNAYIRANTSGSSNYSTLLLQNGDGSWHVTNDDTGKFNIGTGNDPSDLQKLTITSAGQIIASTTSSVSLELNSTDANGGYLSFKRNGNGYGYIGSAYHLSIGGLKEDIALAGLGNITFATGASLNIRGQVTAGGNWLLGTTTDNGERLYVSGAIRATGTITANSDLTLKKNLLKIENALEKVEQINGYTYELKADDSKRHGGVIAQEIDKVFPEIVNTGNDGLMGVEYGNISALLIEAIKEQNIKIKNLETLLASK